MAQQSHVPKFGNWEGENVPYTAFFENARKEKASGVRINPNDPEQNPEAFFNIGSTYDQQDGSRRTLSSGSSSNSSSLNTIPKPKHHHKKSDNTNADDFSYKSASVPKFGQWDENDPRSGEGFTVIFNKVKEEKHIAATNFPSLPTQTQNYQPTHQKETTKKCCCLF